MPTETLPPCMIRVASRPEVGAGHVARCRVLARALCAYFPVNMVLDRQAAEWLPRLINEPFTVTLDDGNAAAKRWSGCILDNYDFDESAAMDLAAIAGPLVVFDDFLHPPSAAALAINGAPHLNGDMIGNVPALLGPRYAIIDPAFTRLAGACHEQGLKHVLVTFGGRDSHNITAMAIDALSTFAKDTASVRTTVVLTSSSQHLENVRASVQATEADITLRFDEKDMAGLLVTADMVIGAGGVSLLERIAAGIPSITIAAAENQISMVEGAAQAGATLYLGPRSRTISNDITAALVKFAAEPEFRRTMARNARKLVDGKGAARVAVVVRNIIQGNSSARERTIGNNA